MSVHATWDVDLDMKGGFKMAGQLFKSLQEKERLYNNLEDTNKNLNDPVFVSSNVLQRDSRQVKEALDLANPLFDAFEADIDKLSTNILFLTFLNVTDVEKVKGELRNVERVLYNGRPRKATPINRIAESRKQFRKAMRMIKTLEMYRFSVTLVVAIAIFILCIFNCVIALFATNEDLLKR